MLFVEETEEKGRNPRHSALDIASIHSRLAQVGASSVYNQHTLIDKQHLLSL